MKTFLQFVIVLILSCSMNATAGVTVKTTSGKVYENAEIKAVEQKSVLLKHAEGLTRIPLEELSKETRHNLKLKPSPALSKGEFERRISNFKFSIFELDSSYATHLGELEKSSKDQGELEQVLEIQKEINEFQAGKREGKYKLEKLNRLRAIYNKEQIKVRNKIVDDLKVALVKYQTELRGFQKSLTISGDIENAIAAKKEEGLIIDLLADRKQALVTLGIYPEGGVRAKPQLSRPKSSSAITNLAMTPAAAAKNKPFENKLGMLFVPVPITGGPSDGQTLLFSVWETRVQDYDAFARSEKSRVWPVPGFTQAGDYPVVKTNWNDAVAFCEWLTMQDRKKAILGGNESYRLPTDHEWSCAVGIGEKEDADAGPGAKHAKLVGIYPWGSSFKPSDIMGNYYGEEAKNVLKKPGSITGYDDGFPRTSPVGSFKANKYGLYDMGGNVQEVCADLKDDKTGRITRGGGWANYREHWINSSGRSGIPQTAGNAAVGFRIVLVQQK